MLRGKDGEPSKVVDKRVRKTRQIQIRRLRKSSIFCNAQMGEPEMRQYCKLDEPAQKILESAIEKLGFSARAYNRILKVARTIADMAESQNIQSEHVAEAIQYRSLDRNFWHSL